MSAPLCCPSPPPRGGSRGWGAVPGPMPFSNFLGNVGSLRRGAGFLLFSCRCPGSLGFGVGILVLRPGLLRGVRSLWALAQAAPLPGMPFCPSSPGPPGRGPIHAPGPGGLLSYRRFTSCPPLSTGVPTQAQGGWCHLPPCCASRGLRLPGGRGWTSLPGGVQRVSVRGRD